MYSYVAYMVVLIHCKAPKTKGVTKGVPAIMITRPMIPVNMPDPIRKRFGYGQLWPPRPARSQKRARSYMPDPTSRILFSSFF